MEQMSESHWDEFFERLAVSKPELVERAGQLHKEHPDWGAWAVWQVTEQEFFNLYDRDDLLDFFTQKMEGVLNGRSVSAKSATPESRRSDTAA